MAAAKRKLKFKPNEFVVYPAHGVGRIVEVEEQEIAGTSLELYVIDFEKEKMTLKVPLAKVESVGMRKLSEKGPGGKRTEGSERPGSDQAHHVVTARSGI